MTTFTTLILATACATAFTCCRKTPGTEKPPVSVSTQTGSLQDEREIPVKIEAKLFAHIDGEWILAEPSFENRTHVGVMDGGELNLSLLRVREQWAAIEFDPHEGQYYACEMANGAGEPKTGTRRKLPVAEDSPLATAFHAAWAPADDPSGKKQKAETVKGRTGEWLLVNDPAPVPGETSSSYISLKERKADGMTFRIFLAVRSIRSQVIIAPSKGQAKEFRMDLYTINPSKEGFVSRSLSSDPVMKASYDAAKSGLLLHDE